MTQVLSPTPEALALASQLLHDGQLVAFPTETVYGLGANALDPQAVRGIFHLMPEEAYGMANPDAVFSVQISELPGSEELEAGQQVYLQNAMGQPFPVKVVSKENGVITFDANHEMAGKELNFKIELVEIC